MSLSRTLPSLVFSSIFLFTAAQSSGQTVRLRCGTSGSYTASDGSVWQGDQYFTGGQQLYTGYPVSNTSDTSLYQYARQGYYGDVNYSIPVANGSYQVTLKFAEIQYASPGQRVFNVTLNGTQVLTNFDLVKQFGYWTAVDKTFAVTVTGGAVQLNLHGVTNQGIVNAIQVAPATAPPTVQLSTTSLTFAATAGGSSTATQPVNITNSGSGTLNWTATKTQSWLTLSAASGTAPSTLNIGANPASLGAGQYTDTVTVTSGSSSQTVSITLNVSAPAPVLTVGQSSFTFTGTVNGSNPAGQTLNIGNSGGGTLSWNLSKTTSWLTLSSTSGTGAAAITVGASIASLGSGTYTDTITVTATGATGSPVLVGVTLVVNGAAPVLTSSPNPVNFSATAGGANPAQQNIAIANTGGGTLNWTASKTQSWLTLSGTSGTAPSNLGVSVSTGALTPGTYNDTVTISSSGVTGSPQLVAVKFVVNPAASPVLSLSGTTANFNATVNGANPAQQNITISNTGGGTLNWTAAKTQSWLTLSAASGTAPATLGLSVSTSGLTAGTYNDSVTITASGATGSPQTIGVQFVVSAASGTNSAAFVRLDTTTQGNWLNNYGKDGYDIEALTPSLPAYAQVSVTGAATFTWNGATTDIRALQYPNGSSRIAATWYQSTSFLFDVVLTDGAQHQVSLYALDYDSAGRIQRVDVLDGTSGAVLDTRSMSGFSSGQYAVWNLQGHVQIRLTLLGGNNAVASALFFDTAGQTPNGTGAFVKQDTTTQGSWLNVYGADGYNIEGLTASVPSYAQLTVNGAQTFTWSGATTDPRALQYPNGTSRIAATWYGSSFNFDLNITDGKTHQVALYAMDYDNSSRAETITIVDNGTGLTLDSRSLSGFAGGQYLVWNLQGHVIIKVAVTGGSNAVVSGLFFSGAPQTTPAVLTVSTNTVSLTGVAGISATSQAVSVTNTGGGTLVWTASGTQSWLTLSANSGTAPSTLTVGAAANLLSAGTYTDTVTVGSSGATGSPQLVAVTLVLTAPPSLSVSTTSLTYTGVANGANPASQPINIANAGGGTLSWTAAKTQPWLTLSSTSGTGPATVTASISTSGLAVGTYTDTVTISASGALQSPKTVNVTLNVTTPTPVLSVSSSAVTFTAVSGGANPASQSVSISNTGGGTLSWTATNTHSWLTLSAGSGTGPATLGLNVSITGLAAGTYTDTVTINGGTAGNSPQSVGVTLTVTAAAGTAAAFIKLDTTTEGSWINTYGGNGYDFIGAPANIPSYAQMSVNSAFIFTWAGGTSDARALQLPNGSSRVAGTWYASGSFTIDLNLTDGATHQIALYAVDYDSSGRGEQINIIDTATGSVLDSRTLTTFGSGQYPVWNIAGHVTIQVTQLLGPNAVVSGIFFDNAGASPVGSTLFERLDTTTLGNWENGYGGDGYSFVGATAALPAYAAVTVSAGAQTFVWAGATSDGRALEIPNSTNRVAGAWYAPTTMSFDVNLTDGNTHRLALYALDYDNGGRNERVDVIDSATGVTLDSRTIGPFTSGQYLVWNLAGHVVFQVTSLGGTNAVISGLFFGRSPLVTTPETLSVSTNALTLAGVVSGTNPSAQGVSITNSGIGTLQWTATANQPWLTLSAGSGTAPSSLSIGANLSGLSSGSYTGTVGINAPGALATPQAVTVTLNVRAQPAILSVSQSGLTFATNTAGNNPAGQTLVITNAGSGSLNWTAVNSQPWLTLSASSGTAPSNLIVGVSTASLAAGVYTDTVVITAAGASGSPTSVAVTLVIGTPTGQHYVSPQGSPNGDGSINNPWDLQTALYQPSSVQPGDIIWVRGGTYGNGLGIFYSRLVGTSAQPIIVRQFPGERATIDGWLQVGCCDQNPIPSDGGYTWFWGLEFASSVTNRTGLPDGESTILDAADTWAPGTKFINNIVHDSRVGLSMWKEAVGAEAYGNVIYFNGFQASDRGHGHGFYIQNLNGTMNIQNNIVFDQFDNGLQFYGTSAAAEKNLVVQGNISFNNGALSTSQQMADDVIFVNTNGVSGIQLLNNYFYFTPQLGLGYNEMGWPGPNVDIVMQGNYFMGGFESVAITDWASVTFQNNTVYTNSYMINFAAGTTPSGYVWDNNTYYGTGVFSYNGQSTFLSGWQGWTGWDTHSTSTPNAPTGVWTFVEPNKYEPGRANIAIYDWSLSPTVSVDVSSAISVGTRYKVLDAQNYFGSPLASGTYTGSPITIPMTGLTIATPNGSVPSVPTHTAPQFGAFVLVPLQ
jgi:hypothetical protein